MIELQLFQRLEENGTIVAEPRAFSWFLTGRDNITVQYECTLGVRLWGGIHLRAPSYRT